MTAMEVLGKTIGVVLLFVAGIASAIYITGPMVFSIYTGMVYPYTGVALSVKAIIGMSLIFNIFKIDLSKVKSEDKTLSDHWGYLFGYIVYISLMWVLAQVYCYFL